MICAEAPAAAVAAAVKAATTQKNLDLLRESKELLKETKEPPPPVDLGKSGVGMSAAHADALRRHLAKMQLKIKDQQVTIDQRNQHIAAISKKVTDHQPWTPAFYEFFFFNQYPSPGSGFL